MTETPAGGDGIRITGPVTGNVQSGSHARARFVQHATPAPAEPSPQVRQLLQAVDRLRAELEAHALPDTARDAACSALDDAEEAVSQPGEPEPGRIRRAVFTVTGALTAVAGLGAAVQALRDAADPWF